MRRVLISDHRIPDRDPLRVEPGDVVGVGERDTQWPAFVLVTAAGGSGWVPSRHLRVDGATGVVEVGYDTTELAAASGETIEVLRDDPESGWSWCRNAEGREGWIPHRVLAPE